MFWLSFIGGTCVRLEHSHTPTILYCNRVVCVCARQNSCTFKSRVSICHSDVIHRIWTWLKHCWGGGTLDLALHFDTSHRAILIDITSAVPHIPLHIDSYQLRSERSEHEAKDNFKDFWVECLPVRMRNISYFSRHVQMFTRVFSNRNETFSRHGFQKRGSNNRVMAM